LFHVHIKEPKTDIDVGSGFYKQQQAKLYIPKHAELYIPQKGECLAFMLRDRSVNLTATITHCVSRANLLSHNTRALAHFYMDFYATGSRPVGVRKE
jgi:hypothetical protein